jgi:hypothetical protein
MTANVIGPRDINRTPIKLGRQHIERPMHHSGQFNAYYTKKAPFIDAELMLY